MIRLVVANGEFQVEFRLASTLNHAKPSLGKTWLPYRRTNGYRYNLYRQYGGRFESVNHEAVGKK
ncbi:hypothetical protein M3175_10100 [Robertmurraya korlensis]|uniref:hypothetical protein n=1 Tax=Robertmurraya korlensis TaxID=519977 RepID=UPI00203CCB69|nr:hypothetical protein [Robertmurraya korlensis]MCM3601083.1 hypothetical protein [Robertmurraya korlensis]